jgi:hypothetical protein
MELDDEIVMSMQNKKNTHPDVLTFRELRIGSKIQWQVCQINRLKTNCSVRILDNQD